MVTPGQWFGNLKTLWKLVMGFTVVAVLIVGVAAIGILGMRQLSKSLDDVYNRSTLALANLTSAGANLASYHDSLLNTSRARTKGEFDQAKIPIERLKKEVVKPIDDYIDKFNLNLKFTRSGRNEAKDLADLKQAIGKYFEIADNALSAFNESYSETLNKDARDKFHDLGNVALATEVAKRYDDIINIYMRKAVQTERDVAKDLNEDGTKLAEKQSQALAIVAIIAIVLGVGGGIWMARFISRRVSHVAEVASKAAGGNLQARAHLVSRDEVGTMAVAFNTMLDRITSLVQTEEERDQLQRRLMDFLLMVSEVSKGDLTRRGAVTADMFGNLADAFNLMLDRFGKLLGQTKEAAIRVAESANAMRETAAHLAQTAQLQERQASQTLANVEGLADAMREVASTAGASSESAQQVLNSTEQGRLAVQETVQGMQTIRAAVQRMSKQVKGLGDRSLEISQIVSTIKDIASQTNLLALNAAIEAAGAGEAGARFAIVADQVRKLAEGSSQAAREVAGLVAVIQTETQNAVVAMEQETQAVEAGSSAALRSGEVFKDISKIAQRSAELVRTIADSSQRQTAATESMSEGIRKFANGAVAIRKSAEETRLTVEELAKLSEGLTSSVGQFKLPASV